MLQPGLYEQVINKQINSELPNILDARKFTGAIDVAEASKILSNYLSEILQKGLDQVLENGGDISAQISLVNQIIELIRNTTKEADFESLNVDRRAELLLALMRENDPRLQLGKTASDMNRPESSIAQSSLFTGAIHEPQLFSELKKETTSADQIDLLVSFIKWSGLRLIIDELREFAQNGGRLRIITTSYMGATDIKAIEELAKLPNTEIKISYDTKRTRLHAKTYVFYRDTGFTTAYVGSSNLSNAAISSGLEWNVKVTAKDLSSTIQKISATFDSYWNSNEFEFYKESEHERLFRALKVEKAFGYDGSRMFFFNIQPYPFQQEILDNLSAERFVRGLYRNLVVSATGTGKTVISAFDYRRFCRKNPGKVNRLLFVAHREEILRQSLDTFQGVLKDPNFGELYVGRFIPGSLDHLFVSIQTINSQALYDKLPENYYDYIIVDEFHHAAAPTYLKLLNHFRPNILLGLTATPERMDGKSILDFFDDRITAEIRLPEAIDRKLLSPFQYFGVSDTIDLNELRWTRGGYDKNELSNLYSLNRASAERRADHIIQSLDKYVTDMEVVKALGFCVSVEHAIFMAEHFNKCGIPSISLIGQSEDEERYTAKKRLVSGEIHFIFVVDIYNEGVDIPEVNTVLFLRPTESLTIFLQQLGRGLRLCEGKECLTVLDFIGQANKKYNFEEKFAALLSNTRHSVQYELKNGFVSAPKGCYIQLERKATEAILGNIKNSFGYKAGLISRIKTFEEDSGLPLTLANFVNYNRLDLRTIYAKNSFARLSVLAGVKGQFAEPAENSLTKAFSRIASIDSRRWITFLLNILPCLEKVDFSKLSLLEQRMFQMFYHSIWGEVIIDWNCDDVVSNLFSLIDSPVMLAELIDILMYKYDHIDFIDEPIDLGFDCPLDLHCTYTRDQLLLAMDYLVPSNIRQGVKWLPDKKLDVFIITLNKTAKHYSPTTMYNDYSINEELFHWQSQSTTPDTSPTGQRYISHRRMGSKVLLFVREFNNDLAGTAPYTYLGTANYVKHEGSKPMNITWKLDRPIPAKYLKKTNKLVVG
jgi:superfamily II DNA or RNA helicase